jgi:hypothetical protein
MIDEGGRYAWLGRSELQKMDDVWKREGKTRNKKIGGDREEGT